MIRRRWSGVWPGVSGLGILGLSLLLAGCGSRAHPVDGQVVLRDGAPATQLAGYTVTFESKEPRVSASGEIQPDGTFHMGTFEGSDGAVLGKHQVAITPPVPTGDGPTPKSRIPSKYEKFDTSGLEVTITRGRNKVTLEVDLAKR